MPEAAADELWNALASIVGGKRVSMQDRDLRVYARDMWPRLLIQRRQGGALEHLPHAVVWPGNEREIASIIRLARKLRMAVIPYGGGSGVCGGTVPLRGGITIDLKRMDCIESISREELTVDVQAGANGERFERELRAKGYTLGHFPSSIYCSTVGGWLACRAAGQLSTKYGKIEDRIVGLTFVSGKGEVIQTDGFARARRGPDWTQLIVGSEGTLGIITSARLRISRTPEITILRGFEFDSLSEGTNAIRQVMQRGLRPAVVRLYDEVDTFVNHVSVFDSHSEEKLKTDGLCPWPPADGGALPHIPTSVRSAEPEAKSSRASKISRWGRSLGERIKHQATATALEHPKFINSAFDALARSVTRSGCKMIIGLEGPRLRTEVEAQLTFAALERAGGRDEGEEPGLEWLAHRYAVSYKMSPVFREGGFVDTMEVASTWDRLGDLYDSVKAAIGQYAVVMAHFSHAYTDGCSIYFSFAARADGLEAAEKKYDAIWRDGMAATTRAGGTISHHHGIGLLKAHAMRGEHREAMTLLGALKTSLDPDNIMNPGKIGLPLETPPPASPSTTREPGTLSEADASEADASEALLAGIEAIVGADHITREGPHVHVRPGSASEVSKLAELAQEHNATLIAVGKGRRSTPTDDLRTQLLVNMGRMNHVLHLDETSLLVHVQSGESGLKLEATLNKRGLTLGDFPPASLDSSIGGLLSVRTPGKSTRRHGTLEDTVLGLAAVLSDGRLLHTRVAPRRATGPDLTRVLCGSEGSLGIITSAHLRLYRLPESRLLSAYRLPSFADALTAVRLALREEASPAAMRIYDREEATVHLGKVCRGTEAIMVAATVGPTSLATCDRDLISSAVQVVGGEPTDQAIATTWWRRRTGNEDAAQAPPTPNLQVSATPRSLAPVYEAICDSAVKSGLRARAHSSRFARDGGVLFFSICDQEGELLPHDASQLESIKKDAESAGAYLLESTNRSLRGYFEDLRNELDPGRHLNPGVLR